MIICEQCEHYYVCADKQANNGCLGKCPNFKKEQYEKPQGELAEKLKNRIEESVCKHCQMNKHCELCEISRVFQIITLTAEEQKGGKE